MTARMNILLFTDSDVFAGTERHILDLARALRELGESVTVACPGAGVLAENGRHLGIPVMDIPKCGAYDRRAIRHIAGLLRTRQVDLVHAHNGRTHIAAALAVKKAGRGACIYTQHFLEPARVRRTGVKRLIANYLHHCASRYTGHTIAISDATRSAILERGDCASIAVSTVHNGIFALPVTTAEDLVALRSSIGLREDDVMIFCAARLQHEKDLPTLLLAMKQVGAACPSARCFIAGEGELRLSLESQIRSLGIARTTRLLGFRKDIPALMQASDIFVLPSPCEAFGLVLVEAMALSKPVIAARNGGPTEILEPPVSGLLFPPFDHAALATALKELICSPEERRSMGEAARTRFLERFTAQRMAIDILKIYRRALDLPESPSVNALSSREPNALGRTILGPTS